MITLYLLAIIALLVGTAAIYMALLKPFPFNGFTITISSANLLFGQSSEVRWSM